MTFKSGGGEENFFPIENVHPWSRFALPYPVVEGGRLGEHVQEEVLLHLEEKEDEEGLPRYMPRLDRN